MRDSVAVNVRATERDLSSMQDPAIAIPILASLDIEETRAFYVDRLAFSEIYKDATYLIVRRGSLELHFWLTDDRRYPENTSCYVRGGEVAALHAEFEAAGVPRLSPFLVRPWNMKEFYLHDPHGNLLRFGMAPDEA